jgi:hypothetical protein
MEKRKVRPCGKLYSQGRVYFLIHNEPVARDSWQGDNLYRWVVVPDVVLYSKEYDGGSYYPHARHIVTNAFVVDFTELPEIEINVLDEYDLSVLEGEPINPENIPYREWLNMQFAEASDE